MFFITCPSDSVVSSLLAPFAHQATKGQRGHVTLRQDPFDHHSDPRYRGAIDLRILAENGGLSRWLRWGFHTQHHSKQTSSLFRAILLIEALYDVYIIIHILYNIYVCVWYNRFYAVQRSFSPNLVRLGMSDSGSEVHTMVPAMITMMFGA